MPLPSKPQQIKAVAKFLDSDFTEGKSLEEVAKAIVDGYHDALTSGLEQPAPPLRVGQLIKTPFGKVRRVAWLGEGKVWIVSDTAGNGWLGPEDDALWAYCEEYRPKQYVEVDGKRKLVEMTDDEIEKAWSHPAWKVGDRLSQHQREHTFEIIATGPESALLRNMKTGVLNADSVGNLDKFYRREIKGLEGSW